MATDTKLLDKRFKEKLDEAIEDFDSNTCIKLIPRSSESKYINFYEGTVCSSPVGAVESVTDVITIYNYCLDMKWSSIF